MNDSFILFGQIQTSQTGGQLYFDIFPCGVLCLDTQEGTAIHWIIYWCGHLFSHQDNSDLTYIFDGLPFVMRKMLPDQQYFLQ